MPKKVWNVWWWRLLAANLLIFPFADTFSKDFPFSLPALFVIDGMVLLVLICKYKTLRITFEGNVVIIARGLFIHKILRINLNLVCAVEIFASPLSRKAGLCNLILYCRSVHFILPLTDETLAKKITNLTRKNPQ